VCFIVSYCLACTIVSCLGLSREVLLLLCRLVLFVLYVRYAWVFLKCLSLFIVFSCLKTKKFFCKLGLDTLLFWKVNLFVSVVSVMFLKLKNFESYLCKHPVEYRVVKHEL
jgi:hypothetical protein